jgi:hypothetical protein
MANRTKPLISAAALASAAAVAVVSPGVAPGLNLPTPSALSQAAYELTTFADVLSVPGQVWTDVLFSNPIGSGGDSVAWGYALGPENYGPDWAKPQDAFLQYGYVNPWAAYCNYSCAQSGLTGAAYLFFDALINGEGTGYENSDNWKVGLVNYFFEPNSVFQLGSGSSPTLQFVSQGFSAASWYLLQGTIGQIAPEVSVPLATAFWGPYSASVFFNFGGTIVAQLLGAVPAVGPLLGNTLLAYLGDLSVEPGTDTYYNYGLSGPLNYFIDLANGSVPWPTKVPWYKIDPATAATVSAAALAVAPAATEAETESSDEAASEGTETETETETESLVSASEASETETESESRGSDASETEGSETEVEAVESEAVETETEAVETEVAESTPEVEAPKTETPVEVTATELAESAQVVAAPKRPRPVRDTVQNVGKQIGSAIASAKAAKAERVEARKARAKAGAASAE